MGIVKFIYVTPVKTQKVQPKELVKAVAGKGLEGDRYFKKGGTFSMQEGLCTEVTFIEFEAIQALKRDCKIELEPGDARRNIITENVALNHYVGKDFTVGNVTLHGVKLCEPCSHLEKLTTKGVLSGLIHRGGLRARIIKSGDIKVGDNISCA